MCTNTVERTWTIYPNAAGTVVKWENGYLQF